jgi:prepilin-type N-terminal cleavage/methylation domain-containing protein
MPNSVLNPMSAPFSKAASKRRGLLAFTLIELLVVIAIIAILASMIFPITKSLNRTKLRTRAKGELEQVQTAIESYKSKVGVYPPDNPDNPALNQLYYELIGTISTNVAGGLVYVTLDGSANIPAAALPSAFGPKVKGFVNTAKPSGGDEASGGFNFFKGIRANQIGLLPVVSGVIPRVLSCSILWPQEVAFQPIPAVKTLNPWRYNSSHPTNNPSSYDLWVDIVVDGKTNRISNWSKEVLINPYP